MKRSVVKTLSCAALLVIWAASTSDTAVLAGERGVRLADTLKAATRH